MQPIENVPPGRCHGTGTVTAVIPLADAVLLNERPCPGCPDCDPERQLTQAVERAAEALAESREWTRPDGVEP